MGLLYLSVQYSVEDWRETTEIYNAVGIAIILPFVALYVIYRTDPRYLIGIALVLLVSAAIEDASGNAQAANDIAIVSYYCLVAGVVLMIADGYIETHRQSRLMGRLRDDFSRLKGWLAGHKRAVPALKEAFPIAVFAALSLFIMQAFLAPGYVLVTDMVFGPIVPTAGLYGLYPFLGGGNALTAFESAAIAVIPGWAIQKIFLFLIFFLSGYGMYVFAGRTVAPSRYYASFLYTVNPFIYARILAGAWALSLAYALTPLALLAFINLTENTSSGGGLLRRSFYAASMFSLVAVFDTHTLVLLIFLSALYYIISAAYRGRAAFRFAKRSFPQISIFIVMFALFNLYWLIVSPSSSGSILGGFTFLDAIAFSSQPTVLHNVLLSVAAMYGFFRTGYLYPITFYPGLLALFILFLFLSVYGLMANFGNRSKGPLASTLAVALVVAVILAAGISSPLTAGIYTYLYNNLPFFNGFREPQKLVAMAVLAYSYLGALGLYELESYLKGGAQERKKSTRRAAEVAIAVVLAVALVAPFAYSYMEINGFNGQLTDVQYPRSWYSAESIMAQNSSDYSVLAFPWHTYMYYNWTQTKFASPFNLFFKQNMIFGGSNSYVGGEEAFQGGQAQLISGILSERNNITHLGNVISLLDAKYVFLSKSADYADYSFLYRQADLSLVLNTSECALFLNNHPVSRAYIVQQVAHVPSYSQLVNLSSSVNLTNYAWVVGGTGSALVNSSSVPLQSSMVTASSYTVQVPGLLELNSKNYIVFIPPAADPASWKASADLVPYSTSQNTSGATELYSIYKIGGGPVSVTFSFAPFSTLAYGYAASGVSFSAAALLLVLSIFPETEGRLKRYLSSMLRRNAK